MEEDIKILEEKLKDGTIYVNCGNTTDKALEHLIKAYKELEEKYEKLSKIAIETTFDGSNNDTEFLARTLLKQGKILFNNESKMYVNPHTDEEFEVYGMMFEKEKCYLLDDDKLDDYTHQLEYQIKNSIPISKIKKLKEENEIDIDEMRPYKHQSPFDFGVLNGIDECCRKLLEDK